MIFLLGIKIPGSFESFRNTIFYKGRKDLDGAKREASRNLKLKVVGLPPFLTKSGQLVKRDLQVAKCFF